MGSILHLSVSSSLKFHEILENFEILKFSWVFAIWYMVCDIGLGVRHRVCDIGLKIYTLLIIYIQNTCIII